MSVRLGSVGRLSSATEFGRPLCIRQGKVSPHQSVNAALEVLFLCLCMALSFSPSHLWSFVPGRVCVYVHSSYGSVCAHQINAALMVYNPALCVCAYVLPLLSFIQ